MRKLIVVALVATACGHKASSTDPAAPKGPKRTTVPSLAEEAQTSPPRPAYATVDPPLGGWSTPTAAPPPTTTPATAPATTPATTPTSSKDTSPTASPPATPPTPAPLAPPPPTTMRAKPPATPNSCAKGHECMFTLGPVMTAPGATGRGTVKGQLTSDANLPACPVDLVDGATKRIASSTAHNGAYELSAQPGHYSISFERCLGCDPGLMAVDIVDAGTATVSLACKSVPK